MKSTEVVSSLKDNFLTIPWLVKGRSAVPGSQRAQQTIAISQNLLPRLQPLLDHESEPQGRRLWYRKIWHELKRKGNS